MRNARSTATAFKRGIIRFHAKTLFATWPKCAIPADVLLETIKLQWKGQPGDGSGSGGNLDWAIVAEELHADGTPHLHAVIKWHRKLDLRTFDMFDRLTDQHGNYQSCRNIRDVVKYVTKYDKFVWTGRDPQSIIEKKKPINTEIAEKIIQGSSCGELCFEYPGYMALHFKQYYLYQSIVNAELLRKLIIPFVSIEVKGDHAIQEWIESAIYQERGFRAKQLYLWGKPGIGKSRLAHKLAEHCHTYHVGYEGWWCSYLDTEQLVIFDEFSGQYSPMFMNTFLDGNVHELKRKGLPRLLKKNKVPCIILANDPPRMLYELKHSSNVIDAFIDRLLIIEVKDKINIECIT